MLVLRFLALAAVVVASMGQAPSRLQPDPPKICDDCDGWNGPREPFKVFGNTYFVGTAGLSSVLITSPAGHILVDGALPQSAALIDAHIRQLGFKTEDIKLIVGAHTHYDHAGGFAALQRLTGAVVATSVNGVKPLEMGGPGDDDPQIGFGKEQNSFPPVTNVRAVNDHETLHVGDLVITAHYTPGHTTGSTSWTWRSCEGTRCLNIVYADSLSAVAAPGFRFTGGNGAASRVESFRKSLKTVAELPCDILLAPHPMAVNLDARLKARADGNADALVDSGACRAYAANAEKGLDARIAEELKK